MQCSNTGKNSQIHTNLKNGFVNVQQNQEGSQEL